MKVARKRLSVDSILMVVLLPALALAYSGGSGTPGDPYRITTAADLIGLGAAPADYDKCFIQRADIDMDPNLAGGKVFDQAVIAPDTGNGGDWPQGTMFSGVFDGNKHVIRNLRIASNRDYLGLFGLLGAKAEIRDLGIQNVAISGAGNAIGALAGMNLGTVSSCYGTGTVRGALVIGGLVGQTGELFGDGMDARVKDCYSTCAVAGKGFVGGLAGFNAAELSNCYSTGSVTGVSSLGGLTIGVGVVSHGFWDTQTSGQTTSDGGTGLTTAQMQNITIYRNAGWKIYADGNALPQDAIWTIKANHYPRLSWQPAASEATVDGFETGDFSRFAWQHQGTPWQVTSAQAFSGTHSARSGTIGDDGTSILTCTRDCQAGPISFAVKVSSEAKYDRLFFRIDGKETAVWSGEQAWSQVAYPVSAGTHTFAWSYEKDKVKSVGEDAAWIDDVTVPAMTEPTPEGPGGIVFVDIPGGTFRMGDYPGFEGSDQEPVHMVTLTGFQMSKYETTNGQYAAYLNAAMAGGLIRVISGVVYAASDLFWVHPYCDTSSSSPDGQIEYSQGLFTVRTRDGKGMADHPMVFVSWYGAKAFCDYYGYRLPTEAQWEYAARGGYHDPYYRYPWGSNTIDCSKANYSPGNVACNPLGLTNYPYTSPVGYYGSQGAYGLYDMSGNAGEWCQDWYSESYYSVSPANNPTGPAVGVFRVMRGGSWSRDDIYCRVADRWAWEPDYHLGINGFRVCR